MRSARIRSSTLTTHEVRLTGRKEARSPAGLPAFNSGMMMALRQICGHFPVARDRLKMRRSSSSARGPRCFRNCGGMSSGPEAPFAFIFEMAFLSSRMVIFSAGSISKLSRRFLKLAFSSLSSLDIFKLLTSA